MGAQLSSPTAAAAAALDARAMSSPRSLWRDRLRLCRRAVCSRQHLVVSLAGVLRRARHHAAATTAAPRVSTPPARMQVLVNKLVFARGFNFPMTVTCAHFTFTVFFYRVMRFLKVFEVRAQRRR
eukprot:7247526-Prymnesium_polylepis.2